MDLEKKIRFQNLEFEKSRIRSQIKKQETYLSMKKYWKNILLRFMKLIFIFMGITEKKYKLMKMGINLYYVKLMFFLLNICQLQKLMKKVILTKALYLRRKDKKHQKKILVVNLLELIRVKKATMQTMKLVQYKPLPVQVDN